MATSQILQSLLKNRTKENKKNPLLCTESKITVKDPNFVHFFQRQSKHNLTVFTVQSAAHFIAAQQKKNKKQNTHISSD